MRIEVEQSRCIGAGQCVMTAPEVFDQRADDGLVELLDPTPPPQLRAAVRDAAALCPAAAISITGAR